ncbi:MamI family restriction endonuclease [Stenotrophomonas maltophilia]|uniref:MamI family restriction endonuclease n=1 Tax=Stenotrophomonas maltophilia TaxID=40324 RepID=UPI0015EB74A0|nr:MamI family restriction endonuclease [Stenotrophomonas maltophilia]
MRPIDQAVELLNEHFDAFFVSAKYAEKTGHPVPSDTRGWSQILVSLLTGIDGLERKKGADLVDGSDVKAANTWNAIDTPRFNGVLKAGTKADHDGSLVSLDGMPNLFFVLWDMAPSGEHRCRVWVVRTQYDPEFRNMAGRWFEAREQGVIRSNNFQLHPPRGKDTDTFRNTYGNLDYPLLFCALKPAGSSYRVASYRPEVIGAGACAVHP